ncbi:hypothetical protein TSOC_002089 [Tetrabaena socialis]|uniref:Uncharacterized protein n=1 Tax=Tetrabaena socialis TaxID=47790 RepID=A0A2J8AF20_9CHLO|nr:hypothetical protein TSOC_002089 [Tetrabaena socialis]|eukprot:PNH11117.1 hypothetical protein TSOC_002089 [Tetrabaena socialis]
MIVVPGVAAGSRLAGAALSHLQPAPLALGRSCGAEWCPVKAPKWRDGKTLCRACYEARLEAIKRGQMDGVRLESGEVLIISTRLFVNLKLTHTRRPIAVILSGVRAEWRMGARGVCAERPHSVERGPLRPASAPSQRRIPGAFLEHTWRAGRRGAPGPSGSTWRERFTARFERRADARPSLPCSLLYEWRRAEISEAAVDELTPSVNEVTDAHLGMGDISCSSSGGSSSSLPRARPADVCSVVAHACNALRTWAATKLGKVLKDKSKKLAERAERHHLQRMAATVEATKGVSGGQGAWGRQQQQRVFGGKTCRT